MGQKPGQLCPQCGTPLVPGQRFCTNCGLTMEQGANNLTAMTPDNIPLDSGNALPPTQLARPQAGPPGNSLNSQPTAPPPPVSSFNSYSGNQAPQNYPNAPGGSPGYMPPPNQGMTPAPAQNVPGVPGTYTPVPVYARTPKRGKGCLITSIVLLLILALGIGGFVFYRSHQSAGSQSNGPGTGTGTSGSHATPTPTNTPATTIASSEQLNLAVTYASVQITLVSAQTAKSFGDDTSTSGSGGVVRINLQENNPTTSNPDYQEGEAFVLVVPGGNILQVSESQESVSPDAGVNRQDWLDFGLNAPVPLTQLSLRVGQQGENQMLIPLQPGADISKYQDQTSNPGNAFKYSQLDWTLKTATLSYSYATQQAKAGDLYLIVTLGVSNPTSDDFVDNPTSYIRLQAGTNTVEPDDTVTLPTEFVAQSTNSGSLAFLVPQGTTSFTLVMLAQPDDSPPVAMVAQTFQVA